MIGIITVGALMGLLGLACGLIAGSLSAFRHCCEPAEADRLELLRAADRVSKRFANASSIADFEPGEDKADAELTRSIIDLEDVSFRIRERLGMPEVDVD